MSTPAWKQGLPPRPVILRLNDSKYYVPAGTVNIQAAAEYITALESRLAAVSEEIIAATHARNIADSTSMLRSGEILKQARRAEAAEAKVAQMQADLDAMTADRDLWREDHGDDCPYKDQLEMAQKVIREYQEQINEGLLHRL